MLPGSKAIIIGLHSLSFLHHTVLQVRTVNLELLQG